MDDLTKAAMEILLEGEPEARKQDIRESVESTIGKSLQRIVEEEIEALLSDFQGPMKDSVSKEVSKKIVTRFLNEIGSH